MMAILMVITLICWGFGGAMSMGYKGAMIGYVVSVVILFWVLLSGFLEFFSTEEGSKLKMSFFSKVLVYFGAFLLFIWALSARKILEIIGSTIPINVEYVFDIFGGFQIFLIGSVFLLIGGQMCNSFLERFNLDLDEEYKKSTKQTPR